MEYQKNSGKTFWRSFHRILQNVARTNEVWFKILVQQFLVCKAGQFAAFLLKRYAKLLFFLRPSVLQYVWAYYCSWRYSHFKDSGSKILISLLHFSSFILRREQMLEAKTSIFDSKIELVDFGKAPEVRKVCSCRSRTLSTHVQCLNE